MWNNSIKGRNVVSEVAAVDINAVNKWSTKHFFPDKIRLNFQMSPNKTNL